MLTTTGQIFLGASLLVLGIIAILFSEKTYAYGRPQGQNLMSLFVGTVFVLTGGLLLFNA